MADDVITLEFLARLCQQTLQETRALRGEVADLRRLACKPSIMYAVSTAGWASSATTSNS